MCYSGVLGYKQQKWRLIYLSRKEMIGRLPGSSQINGMAAGKGLRREAEYLETQPGYCASMVLSLRHQNRV